MPISARRPPAVVLCPLSILSIVSAVRLGGWDKCERFFPTLCVLPRTDYALSAYLAFLYPAAQRKLKIQAILFSSKCL